MNYNKYVNLALKIYKAPYFLKEKQEYIFRGLNLKLIIKLELGKLK